MAVETQFMQGETAVRAQPESYQIPLRDQGGFMHLITQPQPILENLKLTLRNMWVDADGVEHSNGQPLLNETGINSVLGKVQSAMNQSSIMSNIKDKTLRALMLHFAEELEIDLMMNKKKYDIKSYADMTSISYSCYRLVFLTLSRPLDEGERRFLKGTVHEQYMKVDNQKKKGSLLNPWRDS